jgi:hypothetical protein
LNDSIRGKSITNWYLYSLGGLIRAEARADLKLI